MKSVKQKILLFGPIGDFGGRELESGFIASVLSSKYEVTICSTGNISKKSQVFDFNKNQRVIGVKELLGSRFFDLKLFAFLSFLKNGCKGKVSDFVNNSFAKRFLDYDRKAQIVLEHLIIDFDAIFVVAQLSSGLVSDVIKLAKSNNKKVLFRTTGTITFADYDFINSVDCFIHHSQNNVKQIENKRKHKFVIIDQCAYNEIDLFKIPTSNKEINNFLILSRLSVEKGVTQIIDFFLRVCSQDDVLFIAGNGILENDLKIRYIESRNIKFKGFVNSSNVSELFEEIDCLIIPSPEESGPLVGIEAMSAGKVIMSTRVGAMEERMKDTLNQYWFDYNDFESFKGVFGKVKRMDKIQIHNLSKNLKERYKEEYSIYKIGNNYQNVIHKVLDQCE